MSTYASEHLEITFRKVGEPSSRPIVIELVGPPGAGKTALLYAMREQCASMQTLTRVRKKSNVQLILRRAAPLGGIAIRHLVRGRRCKVCLHAFMFLDLMKTLVSDRRERRESPIVLNEGAVFMLSKLEEHWCKDGRSGLIRAEIELECTRWSRMIDGIVILDAPDDVLIDRIKTRSKRHMVKERSEEDIRVYLQAWRKAMESAIDKISVNGLVPVVCFDTSKASVEEIAKQVMRLTA